MVRASENVILCTAGRKNITKISLGRQSTKILVDSELSEYAASDFGTLCNQERTTKA